MWLYAFVPVVVAALGATWTTLYPPSPKVIGAVQHFAEGVVFYAAAGELLPDAVHKGAVWTVVLGGAIGIAAMLLLRHFTEGGGEEGPTGLVAASGGFAQKGSLAHKEGELPKKPQGTGATYGVMPCRPLAADRSI